MTRQTITTPSGLSGFIEYPDSPCFIFSPQPLRVVLSASPDEIPDDLGIFLVVDGGDGRSIQENREFIYDDVRGELVAEFELSRMMQLCRQYTPEQVLHLASYAAATKSGRATESFFVHVEWESGDNDIELTGIQGAYDPGDHRQGDRQVRLFVNYPQTVQLNGGDPEEGTSTFGTDDFGITAGLDASDIMNEVPLLQALEDEAPTAAAALRTGAPLRGFYHTPYSFIQGATVQTPDEHGGMLLVPDCRAHGLYLRWLSRDGSIGYWLFKVSQRTSSGSDTTAFDRHVFNPSVPEGGVYRSSRQANRALNRTISAGDSGLSSDEMDLLESLASAPVVEVLMENVPGAYVWQQVTIAAATIKQQDDSEGPKLGEAEVVVILPELNTVKN